MDQRSVLIVVVSVLALSGIAVYTMPILQTGMLSADDQDDKDSFQDDFVHKHATLFFLVDEERKNLSTAYVERNPYVHFHHDDGVIHVEGPDTNMSTALETLNITVDTNCVRYGLDNETYCEDGENELRFVLNTENVSQTRWMNHTIQQGDNIILFYGNNETTVPEQYFTPLPEGYSPGYSEL